MVYPVQEGQAVHREGGRGVYIPGEWYRGVYVIPETLSGTQVGRTQYPQAGCPPRVHTGEHELSRWMYSFSPVEDQWRLENVTSAESHLRVKNVRKVLKHSFEQRIPHIVDLKLKEFGMLRPLFLSLFSRMDYSPLFYDFPDCPRPPCFKGTSGHS